MTLLDLSLLAQDVLDARRPLLDADQVAYWRDHLDEAGPLVVFYEPRGEMVLAAGHHRVEAARQLGRKSLEADLRPGRRKDATEYSDFAVRTPRAHRDHRGGP